MGALTWIFTISLYIVAECHLQMFKHPRFHLIPKFPEDFFSYDDSFDQDSEPIVSVTFFDQHDVDINEKEIEYDSDILVKKLPEEKHEQNITKEKRSGQEPPQIQPEPIKIISGKPEDVILSVQQEGPNKINKDIPANEKEIEYDSDILVKKLPDERHEEDITKEKRSGQEPPQIQLEPIKIISGKLENAILSVQQEEPNKINKDIPANPKLENAKVNTDLITERPLEDSDADSKKNDQELTKNTDYVLIPVAAINADQLNPNIANPSIANQAVGYPLQATNLNVQPNQFGSTIPQNYVPFNNGVNNNGGQPMYVVNVPNNAIPQVNNPANTIYYLNNPPNNNMGYQGDSKVAGTPYNLVPLGYQQNNQPNNYVVPINQPNNLVGTNQPIRSAPLSNPNGYYVLPNNAYNQQNYPSGYQSNNPNGYVIQPNNGNNLNYQQNNPVGYIQPNNNNNLNNQQNYPNGYYIQPNNLNNQNGYNIPNNMNYQQNNPNGYVIQPNNMNNYPNNPNVYNNQPNNPNGYGNQPNSFNNYPNNYNNQPNNPNGYGNQPNSFNNYPNNYNSQPNNQYSNVNPADNLRNQPNSNTNVPNDQQNNYANQPNNNNYQPNNPNGYNAQPQDLNNQQNYPNGYNNQQNNFDSYKDKKKNSAPINNSGNPGTAGNIPQVLKASEISDNSILVPLVAFEDGKDSVDIKDEYVQKDEESKE